MKSLLLFLILPAFLIGCGSTTLVTTPAQFAEVNATVQGYTSTISVGTRLGESVFKGDSVRIQPDSTFWFEPDKNVWRSVATPSISRIEITKRLMPTLTFMGATIGATGLWAWLTPSGEGFGKGLAKALVVVMGAAVLAVGTPIVAIAGVSQEYVFALPYEVKIKRSAPSGSEPPKTNRE